MSEEIRRAFNDKNFSYISEATILKSRSKIKVSAFEQLFHKFNDRSENLKKYKDSDSEYATISNTAEPIECTSISIRIRNGMTEEIKALPYKMKIQA